MSWLGQAFFIEGPAVDLQKLKHIAEQNQALRALAGLALGGEIASKAVELGVEEKILAGIVAPGCAAVAIGEMEIADKHNVVLVLLNRHPVRRGVGHSSSFFTRIGWAHYT